MQACTTDKALIAIDIALLKQHKQRLDATGQKGRKSTVDARVMAVRIRQTFGHFLKFSQQGGCAIVLLACLLHQVPALFTDSTSTVPVAPFLGDGVMMPITVQK